MYSPTRNGLVKMMVSPATTLLRTPCIARPIPTPATPIPASTAVTLKPNVSSAMTRARAMITSRAMRPINIRTGGSNCFRSSQRSTNLPTQPAAITPPTSMTTAPSNAGPCSRMKSRILVFHSIDSLPIRVGFD